jgi:hypothetical protein
LDEEGRPGQDETTLRPAGNQKFIGPDVDYTAGEAWLPGDRVIPALLEVANGQPRTIVCFDETKVWEVPCTAHPGAASALTDEQRARFPLRVASRLPRNPRDAGDTIRVVISEHGAVSQWTFDR